MKIILIRHGQTDWNHRKKMQGCTDIPLNDAGRKQAREASKSIPEVQYCITSPLSRAYETAVLALGSRTIPVVKDPLLIEQRYGLSEAANQRVVFH